MAVAGDARPDLEKARRDPLAVFATPEEIRDHPALDRAEKVELLRRWEYDGRGLETAEGEGMLGGETDCLERVEAALLALTEEEPPGDQQEEG
ncbi:hypothetical protein AN478_09100 [Thiohalorhabdus denitrificans]|uniref:Uncharacterized protein n=1 Tax=Thiohalorhabdus denitrificans TaxID=381306 RepID=A0A0P9C5Z6_9GAMM|nr:hypothetical protein [Thiohalorhabdus denitrificans]KPV40257.1 hypothetical protein AN478_09100 [Thiohalorhabdus denitrificans]SCX82491.1 hypothetical protein SAMN05661077_0583 [Thiohalorhabdus denitrificans]